ncbi:hypothetical protein ZHAS_00003482 [Anopheles sinensis]|uniref:Peptidase S1 domain-containing protein n=1 Tax=Anopheles sinensis TaxID=74873 RepID=A0A084VEQ1_ANOSI|nr:hypothetical protein ZHAS_00003482 [Anopheles sinensis]
MAELSVLDIKNCTELYKDTYENVTSKVYCVGETDKISACKGGRGGGMFFNIRNEWYLQGIMSFSPARPEVNTSLCDPSKPVMFTDVTEYRSWITRYTNTRKWLQNLQPCKDDLIGKDTECNAVKRFEDDFFIAATEDSIIRVPVNGDPASNVFSDSYEYKLGGLDYDCVEDRFYWSEPDKKSIFSAKYDGTDKKAFVTVNISNPKYLAVDWISRHLYWVDKDILEVASLENPDVRTLVSNDVAKNDKIAIDPLQGKLYRSRENRIEWSNLDGSDSELLLDSDTMKISDMKVYMATGELCYIDEGKRQLDCIDTSTKHIRTIVSNLTNARTFAITDDLFSWTEDNSGGMDNTPENVTLLIAISSSCPRIYSPCAIRNGECPEDTICLLSSRVSPGKTCQTKRVPESGNPIVPLILGNTLMSLVALTSIRDPSTERRTGPNGGKLEKNGTALPNDNGIKKKESGSREPERILVDDFPNFKYISDNSFLARTTWRSSGPFGAPSPDAPRSRAPPSLGKSERKYEMLRKQYNRFGGARASSTLFAYCFSPGFGPGSSGRAHKSFMRPSGWCPATPPVRKQSQENTLPWDVVHAWCRTGSEAQCVEGEKAEAVSFSEWQCEITDVRYMIIFLHAKVTPPKRTETNRCREINS